MVPYSVLSCLVLSDSLRPHGLYNPPGSSVHGDSPDKNTGVGCHPLLQGIFPTQGLNPGVPHCRRILYHLSHQGSPAAAAAAKSLQSCPTLCNPVDGSPPGCHFLLQCMKVKSESEVAQLCSTLRDPMDCSLPGSSAHGIFQARVLEWGAIPRTAQMTNQPV